MFLDRDGNQMNKKSVLGIAACGIAATMLMPASANAEQDRVSSSEKGSLVIFSKIEVIVDPFGQVIQDTFLSLTNDFNEDVDVQLYFINGDSWTNVDTQITLTANQPIFWSSHNGNPAGDGVGSGNVSPFSSAGPPIVDDFGNLVYRGYAMAWAVDFDNLPIRWNHLSGSGMTVNYQLGTSYEYNAWSSQVGSGVPHGAAVAADGTINMDGTAQGYAQPYNELLLNFFAPGAPLVSQLFPPTGAIVVDTDLTLHLVDADLRMDGIPRRTKATINVWNMNETKFSNTRRCITCWDQTPLSQYADNAFIPNNFLLQNIQTAAGKARIDGTAAFECDDFLTSEALPMLGISHKLIVMEAGLSAAGSNLVGMGVESATIQYDALAGGPDEIVDAIRPRRGR